MNVSWNWPGAVDGLGSVRMNRCTSIVNIKKSTYQILSVQVELWGWDRASVQGDWHGSQDTKTSKKMPHSWSSCDRLVWSLTGVCRYLQQLVKHSWWADLCLWRGRRCDACIPQHVFRGIYISVCKQHLNCCRTAQAPRHGFTLWNHHQAAS